MNVWQVHLRTAQLELVWKTKLLLVCFQFKQPSSGICPFLLLLSFFFGQPEVIPWMENTCIQLIVNIGALAYTWCWHFLILWLLGNMWLLYGWLFHARCRRSTVGCFMDFLNALSIPNKLDGVTLHLSTVCTVYGTVVMVALKMYCTWWRLFRLKRPIQ